MKRALIIAGHGSHLDPRSSEPIYQHAAAIRAGGHFDEVAVAFWKEEPSLSRALETVDAADVTVVPLFMAAGYFTNTVIPREMRLEGRLTHANGRVIRYTRPVGCHEGLADVVIESAREAGAASGHHLAVLGHGTPRDSRSADSTVEVANRIAERDIFRGVSAAFLDQEPRIATLAAAEPPVVAVPLFVAEGWHAGVQVPGYAAEAVTTGLIYARPAGLHPAMSGIILDLATEAAEWR